MSLIIAFGHKRQRGKNTVALCTKAILGHLGIKNVELTAFAEPIKNLILTGIFGLSAEEIEYHKTVPIPRIGKTSRELLQTIGTDYFRTEFGNDIWLNVFEREYITSKNNVVLISDMRFQNEANLVKKHDGFLIKVNRTISHAPEDDHLSETALDNFEGWDYKFDNDIAESQIYGQLRLIILDILARSNKLKAGN